MKFQVSFKDPDALHECIRYAVKAEVAKLELPEDEAEALIELRQEKVSEQCSKWFGYGEYLAVDIDTDAGTCTVVSQA